MLPRAPGLGRGLLTICPPVTDQAFQIELGSTRNSKVLGEIYFFRLSLADIIPTSIGNAQLINSIARGLGLHDYYQPGLWNYCEGFNDE